MLLYADLIRVAFVLGAIALAIIAKFWHKILDWAQSSLFPWLQRNLPSLAEAVKDAFIWVDDKVAVPIRRLAKKAWEILRQKLLQTVVGFDRRTQSTWVKRITSFILQKLEQQKPTVKKVETEQEVDWDDLPAEVKEAWLKNEKRNYEVDVTRVRDQQLGELRMAN